MNQQLGTWIEIVADKCASNFKGLAKSTQDLRLDLMYMHKYGKIPWVLVTPDSLHDSWILLLEFIIYWMSKSKGLSDESMHNISTQRSVSWHLPQRYLRSRKEQVNAYYSGLLGPESFVNNEINQVLQGVFWGPEFGSWLWKFRESIWGVTWTPGSSTGQTDGGTLEDLTFRSIVPTRLLHFVREVSVLC